MIYFLDEIFLVRLDFQPSLLVFFSYNFFIDMASCLLSAFTGHTIVFYHDGLHQTLFNLETETYILPAFTQVSHVFLCQLLFVRIPACLLNE